MLNVVKDMMREPYSSFFIIEKAVKYKSIVESEKLATTEVGRCDAQQGTLILYM